jgi:transposase-like protein
VDDLEGSDEAKRRMRVILETLAGQRTIMDACLELGIGKSAFHELRKRVLQAALVDVEPRPAGRPRVEPAPQAAEVERLKAENARLRTSLEVAHVREEILLAMPEVFDPGRKAGEKRGTPSPTPGSPKRGKGGKRSRRASISSRPSTWLWSCGSSRCAPRSCARASGGGRRRTRSGGRSSGR